MLLKQTGCRGSSKITALTGTMLLQLVLGTNGCRHSQAVHKAVLLKAQHSQKVPEVAHK
jgi:hypothetical protein